MGRDISLFSDYHTGENSLTNHCGILFKLIYRESPEQFEQLIVSLLPEEAQLRVGPVFTQQEKAKRSIPDLLICQDSFRLYFETKIDAWFHDDQLARHIDALARPSGVNVLFCLSNFEESNPEGKFESLVKEAAKRAVIVQFMSFEDLLEQIRELRLSNTLVETIEEFEQYLDRNALLPRWKHLLDVVNCGKTMDEIKAGAYMCPNRSGPYTHVRARYLGTYQAKSIPSIHEIDALVACSPGALEFQLRWKNNSQSETEIIERARQMTKRINPSHVANLREEGLQIFLLGAEVQTDFRKDTAGGLFGSHRYFRNIAKTLEAANAKDLASKLKGRKWSEFGQ